MRNAVNYLCAQYHHFSCAIGNDVCARVRCESALCTLFNNFFLLFALPRIETNEKWIFIQTIYKLHMLNLNEEDARCLLLHHPLRTMLCMHACVWPFISFFLWKMANLSFSLFLSFSISFSPIFLEHTEDNNNNKKSFKITTQEKSNGLLTNQQIALSPTLYSLAAYMKDNRRWKAEKEEETKMFKCKEWNIHTSNERTSAINLKQCRNINKSRNVSII